MVADLQEFVDEVSDGLLKGRGHFLFGQFLEVFLSGCLDSVLGFQVDLLGFFQPGLSARQLEVEQLIFILFLHLGKLHMQLLIVPPQLPQLALVLLKPLLALPCFAFVISACAHKGVDLSLQLSVECFQVLVFPQQVGLLRVCILQVVIVERGVFEAEGAELEVFQGGGFVVGAYTPQFRVVLVGTGLAEICNLAGPQPTGIAALHIFLVRFVATLPFRRHIYEFECCLLLLDSSPLHIHYNLTYINKS